VGGVKVAANSLNFMDSGQEEALLSAIAEVDGDLSVQIRDLMFVFDNLADLDDRAMQAVLREVSSEQLALALRGAEAKVRQKITSNMRSEERRVGKELGVERQEYGQ